MAVTVAATVADTVAATVAVVDAFIIIIKKIQKSIIILLRLTTSLITYFWYNQSKSHMKKNN